MLTTELHFLRELMYMCADSAKEDWRSSIGLNFQGKQMFMSNYAREEGNGNGDIKEKLIALGL